MRDSHVRYGRQESPATGGIGHNSRHADPGPADDFVLAGPLLLRQENVDRVKLNEFCVAIRSQGNEDVRHRTVDNALVRHRANPKLNDSAYRMIACVANLSHGRYRYHGMPMEALAFFAGKSDASNLHRDLKAARAADAVVVIEVPRKAGGRPMKFIALKCTGEDRTGAHLSTLYGLARDRYNGAQRAKRDGLEWTDLVEDPIRKNDEMTQPQDAHLAPRVAPIPSARRDGPEAIRKCDGYQSVTVTTRVQQEDCREGGGGEASTIHSDLEEPKTGNGGDSAAASTQGAEGQFHSLGVEASADPLTGTPLNSTCTPTEAEFEDWRLLNDTFARRSGDVVLRPAARVDTDPVLLGLSKTHLAGRPASVCSRAIAATSLGARAITADERENGIAGRSGNRLQRLVAYFNTHLPRHADRLGREDKVAVAKDRAEYVVQEAALQKRVRGVENDGAARQRQSKAEAKDAAWAKYAEKEI